MHQYSIHYSIQNTYENLVTKAFFQLLVLPADNNIQQVMDFETQCNLKNSEHTTHNQYGYSMLQYSTHESINSFDFKLDAKVEIQDLNPYNFLYQPPVVEHTELNKLDFQLSKALYLIQTPLTNISKNMADDWIQFDSKHQVLDFLLELNQTIHSSMQYISGVTNTETTAQEAMLLKKGVCQDYTHIFIALARYHGIPARYISGYLNHGEESNNTNQTHAWAEAFIPYVGWIGFDPTNNLLIDYHYIKIAHGTDYRDCSPITGVLDTTGKQSNNHIVSVINQ